MLAAMPLLRIDPKYEPLLHGLGLASFDAVVKHFAGRVVSRAAVIIERGRIAPPGAEPVDVYFKQYRYPRPSARFWLRRSKARREFDNYAALARIGVPAAERIACAEKRDWIGRLESAWIITRAVPSSQTLVEFAAGRPPERVRRHVLIELARITRMLHHASFFYYDLVWRNILVSSATGEPYLVLIDCPRGGIARFPNLRHRLRDLASLDKSGAKFCRRSERLRFLLDYMGKQRLDLEARSLARRCLDYRRTRWPEDWMGE